MDVAWQVVVAGIGTWFAMLALVVIANGHRNSAEFKFKNVDSTLQETRTALETLRKDKDHEIGLLRAELAAINSIRNDEIARSSSELAAVKEHAQQEIANIKEAHAKEIEKLTKRAHDEEQALVDRLNADIARRIV